MKSKHFLMTAVFGCAMMLMMTSCSKDEDNSTEGVQASIIVNTAALYDELGYRSEMSQMIANGMLTITDSILIYDNTGKLLVKQGIETTELKGLNFNLNSVPEGQYTLVLWQSAYATSGGRFWTVSGDSLLSTLSIQKNAKAIPFSGALGYYASNITIDKNLNMTITPKLMGTKVHFKIENYTPDCEYDYIITTIEPEYDIVGRYLDPNRSEEDCWIKDTVTSKVHYLSYMNQEMPEFDYIVLTHGDNIKMNLCAKFSEEKNKEMITNKEKPEVVNIHMPQNHLKINYGEDYTFYYDIARSTWQPFFFGTTEDFKVWKADRDAGLLVFNPLLKWGCSYQEVLDHVRKTKNFWTITYAYEDMYINNLFGDDKIGYQKFVVANDLLETYFFRKSEDGQSSLYLVVCHSWWGNTSEEIAINGLLAKGYEYAGKIQLPDETEPLDVYYSPDRKVIAKLKHNNIGSWLFYLSPIEQ